MSQLNKAITIFMSQALSALMLLDGCRGAVGKKWLRSGFAKKLQFSVRFCFYEINCGFAFFWFGSISHLHLYGYDARNDVLPRWIGPTNCQPKWLIIRNAEIRHEEKYFDCWSYHIGRWTVNDITWKTVPKPRKSFFLKTNCVNRVMRTTANTRINLTLSESTVIGLHLCRW